MTKIEKLQIISKEDLPRAARSLCNEALLLALDLIGKYPHDAFEKEFRTLFNIFIEHSILLSDETKSTIPEYNAHLQTNIMDARKLNAFFEQIQTLGEIDSEYTQLLSCDSEDRQFRFLAGCILWLIQQMQQLEQRLLSEKQDYLTIVKCMDGYILSLHEICFYGRALPGAADNVIRHVNRCAVSAMGGQAKHMPDNKLKAEVLRRAAMYESNQPATQVARSILCKLDGDWKVMANSLSDPEYRFTVWIRARRKELKNEKTLSPA